MVTKVDGTYSVVAKTGKGSFKVSFHDNNFDADFKVTKKR